MNSIQNLKKRARVMISTTHNPWFNLATEEWIFNSLDENTQTLFLWRNHDTVVIGRNQNPWSECNLTRMETDGVGLARRTSGGGAVFHDLGNTCFTFLSPKAGYDREQNTTILLDALKKLGVIAEASGRNDLVLSPKILAQAGLFLDDPAPRKVSGSAFRETQKKSFHHGTLLLKTDLSRLANYLTPHPKKLLSKGRTSVRSRVMNIDEILSGITHERLVSAMVEAFLDFHQTEAEIENLDHSSLQKLPELNSIFEKFSSWDWRFGHAPQFEQTLAEYFSFGMFELHLNSEEGRIAHAKAFTDALSVEISEMIPVLERMLTGQPFSKEGVANAFEPLMLGYPRIATELTDLRSWLSREVEI